LEQGVELEGDAIQEPVSLDSRPVRVRGALWRALTLDFERSTGRCGDLRLKGVRVRPVVQPAPRVPTPSVASSDGDARGRPGRKSVMGRVEAEMRARADRGELRPRLSEEARFLEHWAKSQFPDHQHPPKASSIQNALRNIYNELKEAIATRN
jgi:hypothetical protein